MTIAELRKHSLAKKLEIIAVVFRVLDCRRNPRWIRKKLAEED